MDDLIYDRTQEDVTYALNNPSSESFLKGAYNYVDFNRVEGWCEYIANALNSYNYNVDVTTKTNWSMSDFPTDQDFERIRQNILNLKKAYVSFTEVPANLKNITYKKANDIEKILHELFSILMYMENFFVYSGVANSGQSRMWQQRFRRKYLTVRGYTMFVDADGNEFVTADDEELHVKEWKNGISK